jgi:uncharacterized repeat protein (TIGR01451 family)
LLTKTIDAHRVTANGLDAAFARSIMISFRALCIAGLLTAAALAPAVTAQTSDMAVTKGGPAQSGPNTDVPFTVTIQNLGPNDAASTTTLTDTMPAGMTFVSRNQNTGPAFNCTDPGVGNNGAITCTIATFTAGSSASFTFVMHIPPGTPAGTFFTNQATASNPADPNPDNDTGVWSVQVPSNNADLAVTKNGPSTAGPNTNVSYSIVVVNNGPATATTVVLSDTLPGTMTFVSRNQNSGPAFNCTDPGAGNGGTINCTLASMVNGASATFTFVGHIPNGTAGGTLFSNTANVTSDVDPTPENDSSVVTTTVSSVDLAIQKSGPATVTAGQQVSYTITVINNGPDGASNPSFTDVLPSQASFVSLNQNTGPAATCSGTAQPTGGNAGCGWGTLASGATATFTLVVSVPVSTANGTVLTNQVTVTSDSFDTNNANNAASVNTTVNGVADLSVVKNGPASAIAGTNISYTITVANGGPSAASTVQLTDTIPAGSAFVSMIQNSGPVFACGFAAGTETCSIATLANGASASFTLTITTPSGATGTLSNTATVSAATADPTPGNNSSTANTTMNASADVGVTKTGPPTAVQNQDVSYSIGVTNAGPSNAANVQLSDAIPAQAAFVSMNQNTGPAFICNFAAGTVTCTTASLAAGASATFTLTVHTNAAVSGGMLNTANVSSTTSDPNPANNSASAATNIVTADVAVTKSGAPAAIAPGSNITYTIKVTNNGPAAATTVTLNDVLPPNTAFVSLGQSGPVFACTTPAVGANGTVNCSIASLANAATTTFTLVVSTAANTPLGSISNTATVSSASPLDPTPGNNTATATTTVALPDLAVTKTPSPPPYGTGMPITWTIAVANNSAVQATGVTVTDTIPPGTTFVSAAPSTGSCSGTTTVTCNLGTLNGGASATIALTVTLPATPGPVTNSATASSSTADANPANNTGSSTVTVIPATQIPTLGGLMLLLLACALAGVGAMLGRLR